MRLHALLLAVTFLFALPAALAVRPADAKTQLILSPPSGAPGSTVRVEGSGFCAGPVELIATAPDAVPVASRGGAFVEKDAQIPAHLPLRSVTSAAGGFVAQVVVPDAAAIERLAAAPGAIDIVAVAAGQPGCNDENRTFITGARFTITGSGLPATGAVADRDGRSGAAVAVLAFVGFALIATGFGLMRRQRTYRHEATRRIWLRAVKRRIHAQAA